MAIRPVVLYPDPVLLKPTQPVARFDDGLRELLRDMADTMYAASGIGLAANQIGVPSRIFVMDISGGENPDELKPALKAAIGSDRPALLDVVTSQESHFKLRQ